jgi:hypothetical protein
MKLAKLASGAAFGALAAAISPLSANAQDITNIQPAPEYSRGFNTAVRERAHPEWDPIGIHAGSFDVQPEVIVTTTFTDNEKDVSSGKQSDLIFQLDPRLSFSSNWSRHAISGGLWYTRDQNTNVTSDSANEYGGSLAGKLDIYNDLILVGRFEAGHLVDPSSDPDAPADRSERPMYDRQFGQLVLTKNLPRLQIQGTLNVVNYTFDSVRNAVGVSSSFSDRNSRYSNAVGKVTYALSPEVGFFVGALVDKTTRPSNAGFNDNSSGYTLGVGSNFDLSRLARGEIQIGYFNEGYERSGLSSDSGLNVEANVQYFPTELTTLSFSLSRSALTSGRTNDTALSQLPFAVAVGGVATAGGATIDHELLRNVILSANVAAGQAEFTGIDRRDKSFSTGFGATYLMNRLIGLDLSYQYRNYDSTGTGARRSYDDNRLLLTVRVSY